jgi:hypothetical protein
LLQCPASYQATAALPDSVEITSPYAEEGTHYHDVMAELIRARQADNTVDLYQLAASFVGRHFYDRAFSTEGCTTAVSPALDALAELEAAYGGGFVVAGVEKQVRFPGIPGAFGTADLLLVSDSHLILVDWKFGAGVPVRATYFNSDNDEYLNPQLLFYITAARASARHLFKDQRKLVGAIIQPRTDEPLTHTEINRKELSYFALDLEAAVVEAVGRQPRRAKGEHCRFAPCKVTCPLWTGPLLDLSAIGHVRPGAADAGHAKVTAYGEYLSRAKALVDMLVVFKPTLDEQLHSFLESGGVVPGWKLKNKTKNRQWVDEAVVVPALEALGFSESEIWQKKLQTFGAADAAAKRRGVAIPDHLRVAPPTTETTIAASDDPAPPVERAQAIANFTEALKKLQ